MIYDIAGFNDIQERNFILVHKIDSGKIFDHIQVTHNKKQMKS